METVVINNARNDKHSQLLALDIAQLRRPPLSSASSGSMNGRRVTEDAVVGKSVMSCSANVLPDTSLPNRDIDTLRAVRGRKRGRRRRLTESLLSRLIAEVIGKQPGQKALIQDIYRGLRQREPGLFSISGSGSWQSRVRRQLSKNMELFVKTSEKGSGVGDNRTNKGHYWQLQSGQATPLHVQSSTNNRFERITLL